MWRKFSINPSFTPLPILAFVLLLAYYIQSTLLIHADAITFTHWAARLLQNGSYTHDFYESNPPLIIYLSIPAAILTHYTSLSMITATRLTLTLFITLAYLLSIRLAKPIFVINNTSLHGVFNITLAVLFFLLPLSSFGQREHLMFAFSMPYLLCLARQLSEQNITRPWQVTAGMLAGIGFALKPFFILTPLFLVSYQYYQSKRFSTLCNASLVITIIAYIIIAIIVNPDYFTHIIPMLINTYYSGQTSTISELLLTRLSLLFWLCLGYFLLRRDKTHFTIPLDMMAIMLVSFYISYLVNGSDWYYRQYPYYALSCLLFCMLINESLLLIKQISIAMLMTSLMVSMYFLLIILSTSINLYREDTAIYTESATFKALLLKYADYQGVSVMSTNNVMLFSTIDLTHSHLASRFPMLWMLPGILHKQHSQSPDANHDLKQLADMIARDIEEQKPALILIGATRIDGQQYSVDYPALFRHYPLFHANWQKYHYLTTWQMDLPHHTTFRYDVYQRTLS